MTALPKQTQPAPDFDFDIVHATVCPDPDTLTLGQRTNRFWPTAHEIHTLLTIVVSTKYRETRTMELHKTSAYDMALGRGLITKNGTAWASGAPYQRHKITIKGELYLAGLTRLLFTPVVVEKPGPVCMALVPMGFFERLTDTDLINQAQDAEYTVHLMGIG